MDHQLILTPAMLPSKDSVFFETSSFFLLNPQITLPSPAEVRHESSKTFDAGKHVHRRPPPVLFPELNLLVKFGRDISIAEGQCLWAIPRLLREDVPVPEIFGWCSDDGEVFIYMELIKGDTLEERWDDMDSGEKDSVCTQLRAILTSLRRLQQDPQDSFIGNFILIHCIDLSPYQFL